MNFKDIIFWFIIFLVILLSGYVIWFIQTESGECMASPLVYGVSKYSAEGEFTCSCSSNLAGNYLFVTKENITLLSFNNYNNLPT